MVTFWIDSDELAVDGWCRRIHGLADITIKGYEIISLESFEPHQEYEFTQLPEADQAQIEWTLNNSVREYRMYNDPSWGREDDCA